MGGYQGAVLKARENNKNERETDIVLQPLPDSRLRRFGADGFSAFC